MTEARRVQRATYGSDGVFYDVGSVPPAEIAEEFGEHIWRAPGIAAVGSLLMPMVQAPTEPFAVQSRPVDPFIAPSVEAPPLSGPGSGVEAWREYAAAKGAEVPEHAKRAEIVEALEAAGVPVN